MADYPSINGRRYSWASAEIKLDGKIYTGITAINYKQGLKSTKAKGVGAYPRGRTKGDYEASADMEMFLQDAAALRKALADKNPSYGLVVFDILVQFTENDEDPVHEVKVFQCRIEEEDNSNASGSADASKEKLTLSPMWIEKDGLALLSASDRG